MSILFVSHASKDDDKANVLEAWLHANGFTDVFVDHHSIVGGEKWREALRASAGACRVVLCLVTESWLESAECFNEFRSAWYMGKAIIPLFLLPPAASLSEDSRKRLVEVCAEDQGIDLGFPQGGFDLAGAPDAAARLAAALKAAGAHTPVDLDPESFAVDRKARPSPFPGLASFGDDDADAALFYGRSRDIALVLEELANMREEGDLRPLVILGASGAGKSSLLKAGVIPRLRKDSREWLPLRAFRPGSTPLLNFADALARTMADYGLREAPGTIRDRLLDVWRRVERGAEQELTPAGLGALQAALEAEAGKLRKAAGRPKAPLLIAVDQAEELAGGRGDEGSLLADYLYAASRAPDGAWRLAFTIRTDAYARLQRHVRFQNLKGRCYDLRAIPVYRFDMVVKEPARRYGVTIDDGLVEALMAHGAKDDVLPLLAFALQRLWRQYGTGGALAMDSYSRIGGLKGIIEDAAERALRGLDPHLDAPSLDGPLPPDPSARRLELARSAFVPALAQIDDQGVIVRGIARWGEFPPEEQELLRSFDCWRLIVHGANSDADAEAGHDDHAPHEEAETIEIAHEALIREWGRLKEWLEPERARLDALRALKVSAAAWGRHERSPAFLDHRKSRLAEARALAGLDRYRGRLKPLYRDYLAACEEAETIAAAQVKRERMMFLLFRVAIVAVLFGWLSRTSVGEGGIQLAFEWPYRLFHVWPHVLSKKAERALEPGMVFSECEDCPLMAVIPPGEFMMGARDGDRRSAAKPDFHTERPRHLETLPEPFAVGAFEVTFREWDACVAAKGCIDLPDSGRGRGDQPVINVSWREARRYVAWLARVTGRPYRLLTEVEWEYAARAGSETLYSWGDELGVGNANCTGCEDLAKGKTQARTKGPVVGDVFPPNAFGLSNMHGNVWEWCEDAWRDDYNAAASADDLEAPRVLRGGSWTKGGEDLRSARRYKHGPDSRDDAIGFRVARTLEVVKKPMEHRR